MAVRKTIVDVSSGVICKWSVVWGERGRGMESCFGWSVGDAEDMAAAVVSGGGWAWDGGSDDADMMRGTSEAIYFCSTYSNGVSVLFHGSVSLTAFSPTLLSGRAWF